MFKCRLYNEILIGKPIRSAQKTSGSIRKFDPEQFEKTSYIDPEKIINKNNIKKKFKK